LIGKKLAHVLTGGNTDGRTPITEQQVLDLEREAFLSLCGEPLTLARIQHMLQKGKPLRN
jgi:3-hydroxyacyl-CoA dehydrogenase